MVKTYNIYCDESCHLEHDNQNYMVLGGIICEKSEKKKIKREILNIKKKIQIMKMLFKALSYKNHQSF